MRIAIVDDDEIARTAIAELMTSHGHVCLTYTGGLQARTALQRDTFDLVFVDWNMPGLDGIELIRWARSNLDPCPAIIMMTARSGKDDIVLGLEAGADDFIVKPESDGVILARTAALTRRLASRSSEARIETFGAFHFDNLESRVSYGSQSAQLTAKEYALAKLFFENLNRPLSRAYLLQTVWNSVADLPTRTLDVHTSKIRQKLNLRPESGYRLQTVFGFGYRLEHHDDPA
jgi:DNA-binding response OmpR family regulator